MLSPGGTMKRFDIQLTRTSQVQQFVALMTQCPCEVDIVSGRYTVDAKSLLGIYSLDLSRPLTLLVHGSCPDEVEKALADYQCS